MNACPTPMPTGYECYVGTVQYQHQLTPEIMFGWAFLLLGIALAIVLFVVAFGWAWRLSHKGIGDPRR